MDSRWNDAEASRFATPIEQRVYSSRLLGLEPALVLHGGGNTSVKASVRDLFGDEVEVLYVKGSGADLATITAAGFAPVRLDVLRRMADLPGLTDSDMVRAQRAATTDPGAPTPSIEAILHAIIPFAFVDHTHADAVVTISNTPEGEKRIRSLYGDDVLIVPYVMPGFDLARSVRSLTRTLDWTRMRGMVLLHHGVFTFGSDARTSYLRMIEMVTEAERYLADHGADVSGPLGGKESPPPAREDLLAAAQLRQVIGRERGTPVLGRLDHGARAVQFSERADVTSIATRGPLTPDHVIRTKPVPLVASGDWDTAVAGYAARYRDYFARHAGQQHTCLDVAPRWVVWPGRGVLSSGASAQELGIVADLARHTARAITAAASLGGWTALPEADLFAIEYWELEQAKLKRSGLRPVLAGKVAIVTGAASGIGRAVAAALQAAGAAVIETDIDPAITGRSSDTTLGVVADARDPAAVARAIDAGVARFGGLDIVVSNAGGFPVSQEIESVDATHWDASLSLNLSSHLTLLQQTIPFLRFGFDPCVVIIGSKNVPAPGRGAAAYSVAKAGLAQLARVAALELGGDGIRVNTLHPHLVLDTALWTEELLASRAANYGMTVDQYRRNNVLQVPVSTLDVANAVVALAGPAFAKTTGAQIPVDGGSDRVI